MFFFGCAIQKKINHFKLNCRNILYVLYIYMSLEILIESNLGYDTYLVFYRKLVKFYHLLKIIGLLMMKTEGNLLI